MFVLGRQRVSSWAGTGKKSANNFSDGNIRYYEYENDKFEFLSEYKSSDQQRGIAFLPRRGINVSGCHCVSFVYLS